MCSESNNYQCRKWEQTVLQTNYLQTQNVAFFVFLFHKVKVYFALRTLENSQTGGFLMHFSKNCFFQWPFNKSRPQTQDSQSIHTCFFYSKTLQLCLVKILSENAFIALEEGIGTSGGNNCSSRKVCLPKRGENISQH